jgi:hypothetical protein
MGITAHPHFFSLSFSQMRLSYTNHSLKSVPWLGAESQLDITKKWVCFAFFIFFVIITSEKRERGFINVDIHNGWEICDKHGIDCEKN